MMFVNDEGWWQFVSNMVGPQEANSLSLCINDTAVMKRVNMKNGDMILEMGRCFKKMCWLTAAAMQHAYDIYDTCRGDGCAY